MERVLRASRTIIGRHASTGPGQAALMVTAGGAFGLAMALVTLSPLVALLGLANVLVGLTVAVLPWHRWPTSATFVIPIAALAVLSVVRFLGPDVALAQYGVWYLVVFVWVGLWYPPMAAVYLAPIAAAAYVAPFLPGTPAASGKELGTVVLVIPVATAFGLLVAWQQESRRRLQRELEENAALLATANLTDDLTGVGNRRRANALLDGLGSADAVAILDLDHFKAVNDTLGHAEGDRILAAFGQFLGSFVRGGDAVARFGGEEFILILRAPRSGVRRPVERLLDAWRSQGTGVTISAGVARHRVGCAPSATLERADACLYAAKEAGRDRVVTEDEVPDRPDRPDGSRAVPAVIAEDQPLGG